MLLREPAQGSTCEPAFHAWPPDTPTPTPGLVPLFEFVREGSQSAYWSWAALPGYRRADRPLCLVREYPYEIDWPDGSGAGRANASRIMVKWRLA